MSDWLHFINKDGYIHMCEKCRLVMRAHIPYSWNLVAGWYDDPPENTIYVICPDCVEKK